MMIENRKDDDRLLITERWVNVNGKPVMVDDGLSEWVTIDPPKLTWWTRLKLKARVLRLKIKFYRLTKYWIKEI